MRERCGDDMIRIAIVDDENMVCSGIEDIVFQLSMDNDIELETEVYLSGNELCSALKSHECFNLIFLDIEMDNGDGISAGNYLRDKLQNDTTQIVYVEKTVMIGSFLNFTPSVLLKSLFRSIS